MPRRGPRYSEQEARLAIAESRTWTEALRRLGMRPAGGNHTTLKRYAREVWQIDTGHFDPEEVRRENLHRVRRRHPIEDILVEHSTYARSHLKRRLYAEGLKRAECEMCGQDELWRGKRISLILDHINGCATDNRLENLRIVCPNCAATLDTHCGKMLRRIRTERPCPTCGEIFYPTFNGQRYCTRRCAALARVGVLRPHLRRTVRPPHAVLVADIEALGYLATGRKYGVSDNAIRKWVHQYERDATLPSSSG